MCSLSQVEYSIMIERGVKMAAVYLLRLVETKVDRGGWNWSFQLFAPGDLPYYNNLAQSHQYCLPDPYVWKKE